MRTRFFYTTPFLRYETLFIFSSSKLPPSAPISSILLTAQQAIRRQANNRRELRPRLTRHRRDRRRRHHPRDRSHRHCPASQQGPYTGRPHGTYRSQRTGCQPIGTVRKVEIGGLAPTGSVKFVVLHLELCYSSAASKVTLSVRLGGLYRVYGGLIDGSRSNIRCCLAQPVHDRCCDVNVVLYAIHENNVCATPVEFSQSCE